MAAKTQDAAGKGEPLADDEWFAEYGKTSLRGQPIITLTKVKPMALESRIARVRFPAAPREPALAAPTGETVPGLWDVMVSMALKPRQVCVSTTDEAQVAALLAARVPTPIAEPEIMALARRVIEAWESPDLSVRDFDKSLTVLRDALVEFDHYSTEARDAD